MLNTDIHDAVFATFSSFLRIKRVDFDQISIRAEFMNPLMMALIAGSILLLLIIISWVVLFKSFIRKERRPEADDLLNQIPEAWIVLDAMTLKAVSANQKALNVFAIFREENLKSFTFLRMFREDLTPDEANLLIQAVDNNTFINKTLEFRSLQNRIFRMVLTVSRISNGNLLCRFSTPLEQAIPVISTGAEGSPRDAADQEPVYPSISIKHEDNADDISPIVSGAAENIVPLPIQRVNANANAIAILDATEAFNDVNADFAKLTGYTIAELKRIRFYELMDPSELASNHDWFRKILTGEFMVSRFERTVLKKDGSKLKLEFMAACIHPGQAVSITALDNTDAREEQAKLIKSRGDLIVLFDNTDEAVFSIDNLGRIIACNSRFEALFPHLKGRMKAGQEYASLLTEVEAKIWKGRQQRVFSGEKLDYREELPGNDFRKSILEVILYPIRDDLGLVSGLTYTARDITHRLQQEEQLMLARDKAEQATASKSRFLAVMSHEIRNPLNGLLGVTELLGKTTLDKEQKEFVRIIKVSGEALLQVISDILDFSKMEARKMQIELLPFSIGDLLDETVQIMSGRAKEKNLTLKAEIGADTPKDIIGDKARLRQILLNLAGNGIKFTGKGGVTIKVGVDGSIGGDAVKLKFEVKDSGIGIPSDRLNELFADFAQGDVSIYRKFGGTGLGLNICKTLVELMGGKIWAESRVGEGASFFFTLPVRINRMSEASLPSTEKTPVITGAQTESHSNVIGLSGFSSRNPLQIIIVDDSDINRLLATKMFEQLGYKVVSFEGGKAALKYLTHHPADLVFMDVQMPDWDGQETSRKIRSAPLVGQQPVIIAMTAFSDEENKAACLAAGMDDFVTKPISISDLKEVILKWSAVHNVKNENQSVQEKTEMVSGGISFTEPQVTSLLIALGKVKKSVVLKKIVQLFERNSVMILAQLRAVIDEGDFNQIARTSAELRRICEPIGASEMIRQCVNLENEVRKRDLKGIRKVEQILSLALPPTLDELSRALDASF